MELAQLRNFLKIAEMRNFTRASAECGVSQPALSQQIARLESELGCPVFERQGRTLKLTEAGELLRRRAVQIVAMADDTARQLRDDGRTGRVVVAAIPTIAPYVLPGLLREFRRQFPEARVEVNEEVTESLLKRCQQGDIDVGLIALPVDVSGLEVVPLFEDELLLVMAQGHPMADLPRLEVEDIRGEPFVLLDEAHCLTGHVLAFCGQRSVQPVATGRASQLATVQELVAAGHGVSLVPAMAREVDASPTRVYRRLDGQAPSRTIAACWNPWRYQSRLAASFLRITRDYRPTGAGGGVSDSSPSTGIED